MGEETRTHLPRWDETLSHGPGRIDGAPLVLSPGSHFGGYDIQKLLGRGGFAEVWRAERVSDGYPVALKVLSAARSVDEKAFLRFEREGQLASRLNHPRAVYVLAAERIDGYPVIVMEVAEAGSLQQLVEREGPLPVARAVDLALDLLDGLEAAHKLQIVHRDVKPSNGFLDAHGRAKIGDFGISRSLDVDAALLARGAFAGTLQYAPPEQILGEEVDFRSDFYSLGGTLHYLLTGRAPFDAASFPEFRRRVLEEMPAAPSTIRPGIPKRLDRAVLALLEKEPERRPPTHAAVRALLAPDSNREWKPALRRIRTVAGLIDMAIVQVLVVPISIAFHPTFLSKASAAAPDLSIAEDLLYSALMLAYFSGFECLWRKTPGKALLGLRVAQPSGGPPSPLNVFMRGLLFVLPFSMTDVLLFMGVLESRLSIFVLNILIFVALFATQRAANGRAAVHDLLTSTRIFGLPKRRSTEAQAVVPVGSEAPPSASAPATSVGPYRVLDTVWQLEDRSLRIGFDAALGRRVWIYGRSVEDGRRGPLVDEPERTARLRWIRGATEPGLRWDAFEYPDASLSRAWASAGESRSWEQTAVVLSALLRELEAGVRREDLPVTLDVDHVLVAPDGSLKIAEFPVAASATRSGGPINPARVAWEVAILLLDGPGRSTADDADPSPRSRMPARAWTFVKALHGSPGDPETLHRLGRELDEISTPPAPLNRRTRAAQVLLVGGLPGLLSLLSAVLIFSRANVGRLRESTLAAWFSMMWLSPFGALAVLAALLMRRGALFGLTFRVSAVTEKGAPAGRVRCVVRAVSAWSVPLFFGILTVSAWSKAWAALHASATDSYQAAKRPGYVVGYYLGSIATRMPALPGGVLVDCAVLMLVIVWLSGVVATIANPDRGWQDRIAGTWLVRR